MSWETDYAALIRRKENERANLPKAIADRLVVNRANKRVRDEVRKLFPTLTTENAEAAIKFQQERFEHIVAEERSKS